MANAEINDLTNKPTPLSTDEVEIQATAGGASNKATLGNLKNGLGLVKSDVGLGDVDNTSDATKYTAIANGLYPVGTIYTNRTNSANPSTYLLGASGQTWVARTDVMFMARGSTYTADGGSATHSHNLSNNGWAYTAGVAGTGQVTKRRSVPSFSYTHVVGTTASASSASTTVATELGGATDSGSNIPPMEVVYAWERTA